jgi:uncharacterized protein
MEVLEAIRKGDIQALQARLAAFPVDANATDEKGVPAVMLALYHGRRDCAQALLEAGAQLDFPVACALGATEEVVRLLDADPSNANLKTQDGWTALHLAAFFGQPAIVHLLLSRGADPLARSANDMANLPLHAAAAARHANIVRILLEAGIPANSTQHGGYTALHSAAQNNDKASMDALLQHGGDMNLAADDGKTPASLLPKT